MLFLTSSVMFFTQRPDGCNRQSSMHSAWTWRLS